MPLWAGLAMPASTLPLLEVVATTVAGAGLWAGHLLVLTHSTLTSIR